MDHGAIHIDRGTIGFPSHMDPAAIHMNRFSIHTDLSAILMDYFVAGMDRFRTDTDPCVTQ